MMMMMIDDDDDDEDKGAVTRIKPLKKYER